MIGFVYPCYPIAQASQALYELKNLLVLPLSKKWSDSKEIEKLNSAEEAESNAKPDAATKLS